MRINIEIDDRLMETAMQLSGLTTKRAKVEQGRKLLIRLRTQTTAIDSIVGIGWDGDLNQMRRGRSAGRGSGQPG